MVDRQRPIRSEVEHAEELLNRLEQQIKGWLSCVGQTVRGGPGAVGTSVRAGLSQAQELGKQAARTPADTVTRRIRRKESPQLIDLNSASADDLMAVPGIGTVLAQRIIDRRTDVGPYESIDDLSEVTGLSGDVIEEVGKRFSVGDETDQSADESE